MKTVFTAEEFFDEVMFPIFFQDERHLMHVANSPFFQKPADKDLKDSGLQKSEYQFQKLKQKIVQVAETGADASFYVGFSANGPDQTTAGQVTDLSPPIEAEELYASWIGNALAVRVEGSQCLLIDSEPVLWHLFEGWQKYRDYMKPVKEMAGRQIETWNGYWLAKGDLTKASIPPTKAAKIETYAWVVVIARLLQWHAGEVMPVYIFSLGQTNTTYGFLNIHLPQLKRLESAEAAIHKSMTSQQTGEASFWENYIPEYSLREVCQLGEVGLRGLRPLDYGKLMEAQFTNSKITDKNPHLLSNIQIWLMAMLNNKTELRVLASTLIAEIIAAETKGTTRERSKATDAETKALLDARGLTSFVNALTDFVAKNKSATDASRAAVDQILTLPADQFPLFKALMRFEYVSAPKQ